MWTSRRIAYLSLLSLAAIWAGCSSESTETTTASKPDTTPPSNLNTADAPVPGASSTQALEIAADLPPMEFDPPPVEPFELLPPLEMASPETPPAAPGVQPAGFEIAEGIPAPSTETSPASGTFFNEALGEFRGEVEDAYGGIQGRVEEAKGELRQEAGQTVEGIKGGVRQTIGEVQTGTEQTIGEVREGTRQAIGEVRGGIEQTIDEIKGEVGQVIGGVKGDVNQRAESVKGELRQSAQGLKEKAFNELFKPIRPAPQPESIPKPAPVPPTDIPSQP